LAALLLAASVNDSLVTVATHIIRDLGLVRRFRGLGGGEPAADAVSD
jgi:hypothetical protein